jgi:hypothetical protein
MADIVYCALLGWWGVPFGLLITPWQILMNIGGLVRMSDGPSDELRRIVRIDLAIKLAAARKFNMQKIPH